MDEYETESGTGGTGQHADPGGSIAVRGRVVRDQESEKTPLTADGYSGQQAVRPPRKSTIHESPKRYKRTGVAFRASSSGNEPESFTLFIIADGPQFVKKAGRRRRMDGRRWPGCLLRLQLPGVTVGLRG